MNPLCRARTQTITKSFVRCRTVQLTCRHQCLTPVWFHKWITLTLVFLLVLFLLSPPCAVHWIFYPWTLEPIVCRILGKRFIEHALLCLKSSAVPMSQPPSPLFLSLSLPSLSFMSRIWHIYTPRPPESYLGRSQSRPSEGADRVGDSMGTQVTKAALTPIVPRPVTPLHSWIKLPRRNADYVLLQRFVRLNYGGSLPRSEEELMNVKP